MPPNGPSKRLHIVSRHEGPGESAPVEATDSVDYEALLVSNLDLVEAVIDFVCHRHRLPAAEAEEFGGEVKLRLIDRNYEILRRFQHRSSLRTYLTVVIQRLFLDYRNRLWGKWRPSAEARRLGAVATRLEMLITRDGLSFDQACETLQTNESVTLDRVALEEIAKRLPVRTPRIRVSEEALDGVAQLDTPLDAQVSAASRNASARRIRHAVARAVESLPPQDRLILRLRFYEDFGVADIARTLQLEQKPLYRRLDNLLTGLRSALEEAGIDAEEACDAVEGRDFDVIVGLTGDPSDATASAVTRPPTE